MSAQTGTAGPSGPVSQRLVDRAKFRVDRLKTEPNPIWIRELKQSARLARTPIIMTAITILMTLLIASIGGIMSADAAPAKTGVVLFQVFFSLAYFVVTLVGPAVAANSIASEREGRTWEAVLLTGIPPGEIARGKFLAAYTAIGMYVVILAPVGALPFLFGGVTALEVVVAFLFLFLIALLSVAFGLAMSSKMTSLRVAIVLTLLLAFPMASTSFSIGGFALSIAAHKAWPDVAEGAPIWLPAAYERAPFGSDYLVFLVALPVVSVVLPAWFLYEVTIANLTAPTDDRSSGLKRWFVVAMPVLTAAAAVPALYIDASDRMETMVFAMCALYVFLGFAVFLFAGEPIGPSRRVVAHWDRDRASRIRRLLGPGVMRSAGLLLVAGVAALAVLAALGVALLDDPSIYNPETKRQQLVCFAGYAIAFYVFLVGLGAFLRARTSGPMVARVLLFTLLFAVSVGPWIVAAIAGIIADTRGGSDDALAIGAPSPFYVFLMMAKIDRVDSQAIIIAGVAAMLGWVTVGLALLGAARARCARVMSEQAAALAQTETLLRAEDEAAAAAAAGSAPADDAAGGAAPAAAT